MTDTELNDLLYELENSGFSAEEIHDAIEDWEKSFNCSIQEESEVSAAIEITQIITNWRK